MAGCKHCTKNRRLCVMMFVILLVAMAWVWQGQGVVINTQDRQAWLYMDRPAVAMCRPTLSAELSGNCWCFLYWPTDCIVPVGPVWDQNGLRWQQ